MPYLGACGAIVTEPGPNGNVESGQLTAAKSDSWYDGLILFLLILLNFACYYRTLNGYFLADDFIHVSYLYKVFSGHPELLLANFVGNWMNAGGTTFYRPLISLTLAFDYWLGAGRPLVFHISNTLYQAFTAIFLFLLTKNILREYGNGVSRTAAFFAAVLFSLFPLHTEVVSWTIARVDSVCALFYLAAFYFYLAWRQSNKHWHLLLSIASFVLSLLSKEMAVTLPFVLIAYEFFLAQEKNSMPVKLKLCWQKTWKFILVLGLYFAVRTLALGTITGGYSGSIGEGLSTGIIKRLIVDGSLERIFFPFNAEIFASRERIIKILHWLYYISLASVVLRLLLLRKQSGLSKYAAFSLLWFVMAMLPTYQVLSLTTSLQGSRFFYLGSAPFCLLMTLFILPLFAKGDENKLQKGFYRASICLLSAISIVFAITAYRNNLAWAHAFSQVRTFRQAIETELAKLSAGRQIAILNVPQRIEGAHMIYNGAMLDILLNPPLSSKSLIQRVISFEPMTYGDADLILPSRLRNTLEGPGAIVFLEWDMKDKKLRQLNLSDTSQEINFKADAFAAQIQDGMQIGDTLHIKSPLINLPTPNIDFINVALTVKLGSESATPPAVWLSWRNENEKEFSPQHRLSQPLIADGLEHTYSFAVAEHKSWIGSEKVSQIDLEFPFMAHRKITNAENLQNNQALFVLSGLDLVSAENSIPTLKSADGNLHESVDGVYHPLQKSFVLFFNANKVKDASGVMLEVSQPNSWFEHYSNTYRDKQSSEHKLKSVCLKTKLGVFPFCIDDFPMPAYYQVRVAGIDKANNVVGYFSDPINLQIPDASEIVDSHRGKNVGR